MSAAALDYSCDLLVVGSGAAGMAAAVTARASGLRVIVIEKDRSYGGTTAFSGGWIWVPGNSLASRAGLSDQRAHALRYIEQEAGARFRPELVEAFLDHAPSMVDFFERETAVHFELVPNYPDYHQEYSGAVDGGRSLLALPLDGHRLGAEVKKLRPPRRSLTLMGMTIGSGPDLWHFYNATRSIASAWYTVRRLVQYGRDLAVHGRNMRLTNGEALAARLYLSARDLGIPVWLDAAAETLLVEDGRVTGARLVREGRTVTVLASRGVVLACGGFSGNAEMRRAILPHHPEPDMHLTMVPDSVSGDGIRMAEAAGAVAGPALDNPVPWMPVSRVPLGKGSEDRMLHVVDRGKPGFIAVLANGRRFVSEARPYHDFVKAMLAARTGTGGPSAFLIADHRAVRKYGMGYAKPHPLPLTPYLRSGYLVRADTVAGLAELIGIDSAALEATVAAYNKDAADGRDREFKKGTTAYERFLGDPMHCLNPCVAPLDRPPFYAVRLWPGDIGSFAGIETDRHARAIGASGEVIPGLYVAGNDMQSVFGGGYPGAGATLGPALTFGFIAARHAAKTTNI